MKNYALRFAGMSLIFAGTMLLVWAVGQLSTDAMAMMLGIFLMLLSFVPTMVFMGGRSGQRRGGDDVRIVHNHLHVHANELEPGRAGQLEVLK